MAKRLLVFAHAGLCNRLLPLVSGWRAADLLGRRLVVCWADAPRRTGMPYEGDRSVHFNDVFQNEIEEVSVQEVSALAGVKWFTDHRGMNLGRWKAPKDLVLKDPSVIVGNTIPKDLDDELVAVRTSRLFGVEGDQPTLDFLHRQKVSYLEAPPIVKELRPYFSRLKPVPRLAQTVDEYRSKMTAGMLGVHVRKTDFPWRKPAVDENERVAAICDAAMKRRAASKLFLSTDSPDTDAWFRRRYGDAILSYACPAKYSNNADGAELGGLRPKA
ncbi:MAG: hypothetical protein AAFX94_09165 [Myxococcota bacterium]